MKSIIIIIDYFGDQWPEWFPVFLESCRYNPTISWLIHTNCPEIKTRIDNVNIVYLSYDEYLHKVNSRLKTRFSPGEGYKLCEVKPMLGFIHEDEIKEYDFFGYGDLDVIYGNIRKFYTDHVLKNNIISNHEWCISGHLCLIKNKKWLRKAFRRFKNWRNIVNHHKYLRFDEDYFIKIFSYPHTWKRKWYFIYDMLHLFSIRFRRNIYLREQYTTPLTEIPWTNLSLNHPKVWFWKNGKITNNLDGDIEFIYLHFMNFKHHRCLSPRYGKTAYWKKLPRLVHLDIKNASKGIRIDQFGFHEINKYDKPLLYWVPPGENKFAKDFIIVRLCDGMGNQMFQYACAYAIAKRTGKRLYMDTRLLGRRNNNKSYRQFELGVFNHSGICIDSNDIDFGPPPVKYDKFIINNDGFIEEPFLSYTGEISKTKTSNLYLSGYFQSEKYFMDYAGEIRNEFSFNTILYNKNKKVAEIIQVSNSIGIHIRRGDYVVNKFMGLCPLSYYEQALEIIRSKVPDPTFFIFSDDNIWPSKNLKLPFKTYFIDYNMGINSFYDMQLMSLCKHQIIANSTFSWWAAWLNKNKNKIVISPKKWFGDEETNQKTGDLIPESWLRI